MARKTVSCPRTKKSLAFDFENASTTLSRMRGLMFRKKCVPLLFDFGTEGFWPIHSFFVAFEFDAIYLSSDFTVSGLLHRVRPFVAYASHPNPARYLLELPCGSAKKLGLKLGDKIGIA